MQTSRAIIVAMHQYTPFGSEFYRPIYESFINRLEKYQKDFTTLYLVDSNWNITNPPSFAKVIKVSPHLRYYDAYKEVIKQIEEKYVLFLDNDFIIWGDHVINDAFSFLTEGYDVVSIYDTIGTMKVDLPDGKNKFCPYFFASKRNLLLQFLDIDWGPDAMPYTETLGLLTEALLKTKAKPYEFEEDKTGIRFDGTKDGETGKKLGYYHVRAGSTPAYLLATKYYGDQKTYWEYLNNQPKNEYIRQCFWYKIMGGDPSQIITDAGIKLENFNDYVEKAKRYHGLPNN